MGAPTQGVRVLTESQREWLRVREYLQQHRDDLGQVAAEEHPDVPKVDGTSLLTRPDWLATEPLPIDSIDLAMSTLTIRHDRVTGAATFLQHRRDPAKVGHAGGLYMIVPVGIFQASNDQPCNECNDFSLRRCLIREYAEELLGESADHGGDQAPINRKHPQETRVMLAVIGPQWSTAQNLDGLDIKGSDNQRGRGDNRIRRTERSNLAPQRRSSKSATSCLLHFLSINAKSLEMMASNV